MDRYEQVDFLTEKSFPLFPLMILSCLYVLVCPPDRTDDNCVWMSHVDEVGTYHQHYRSRAVPALYFGSMVVASVLM